MAKNLHTFNGNEVIATELPNLLNQNFEFLQENSLKTVNGVEKDENNNVDVTFLTSQVIPTNSDLNNFRESGEYTRELDTIVVANSPTEKSFFLTVLASKNLVKQVVTEIDRKDPMTFTRTLSGANWSPWVEGGVDIGIWKSEETVKVGDVRFLKGRENAGYVLECVKAGVTGESQPVLEGDIAEDEFNLNNFDGTLSIEKGGTGATTAEQARENLGITPANIGALPLSGGTMQGNLHFIKGAEILGDGRKGYTKVCGGSKNEDGARFVLYGVEYGAESGAYKGIFQLVAADANGNYSTLFGYPDGTLTWGGKSLLVEGQGGVTPARYITSKWTSGTNWYEVYNDGWVRQGGIITPSAKGTVTITLHKKMANTNYVPLICSMYPNNWVNEASVNTNNKTVSSFQIYTNYTNGNPWLVEGQGA